MIIMINGLTRIEYFLMSTNFLNEITFAECVNTVKLGYNDHGYNEQISVVP
jgi:hypothetical protein